MKPGGKLEEKGAVLLPNQLNMQKKISKLRTGINSFGPRFFQIVKRVEFKKKNQYFNIDWVVRKSGPKFNMQQQYARKNGMIPFPKLFIDNKKINCTDKILLILTINCSRSLSFPRFPCPIAEYFATTCCDCAS